MADFTINTLDDLFAAFDTINNSNFKQTANIYLEKDIDFNDYSKYWYNQSTLFTIKFTNFKQTINIYGKGHSIKNIYLVNGRIFETYCYGSGDCNQALIFYDVDFDFVLNRNPVETKNSLAFIYAANKTSDSLAYTRIMFYNCTFRSKLFLGAVYQDISGSAVANSRYLFDGVFIPKLYYQFTNCIFNIEYYRSYFNNNVFEQFNFTNNVSDNKTAILNSQFYMKLYLTDKATSVTNTTVFFRNNDIHNTFIILDIRTNTSSCDFVVSETDTTYSNTYFVIKKTNKPLIHKSGIRIQARSSSSSNNFVTIDPSANDTEQIEITHISSDKIMTIDYQNAKDADYLIENVGFTIKGE